MASGIPRFCGGEDDDNDRAVTVKPACEENRFSSETRKEVYCKDSCDDAEDDSLRKRSVKRASDDSHLFDISNKKSKVEDKRKSKTVDESFSVIKKSLDKYLQRVEKSYAECYRKVQVKEQRLKLLKRHISKCSKELANKKRQVKHVRVIDQVVSKRKRVLNELHEKMQIQIEECAQKMQVKIAEGVNELVGKEEELGLMEDLIEERRQELKRKEMELCLVMENINKERQRKEVEYEDRVKEHKLKMKKHFEERLEEFQSKMKEFKGQKKELKLVKKCLDNQVNELELMEKQLDNKRKEFESTKGEFESQLEEKFEEQKKELELEKLHLTIRVEELESKEKQLEGRMEECESKKRELESQVGNLESQKRNLESQVKELKLTNKYVESRVEELESKEKEFEKQVGMLKSDEEQLQAQMEELKQKIEQFEKEKESGNQLSPTIDENGLQLVLVPTSEQNDETDSFGNVILNRLQASPDPSKDVLDIIQNPIDPWCGEGHNIVTIRDDHITMLVQLMKISPDIKPGVREEAMKVAEVMKLALDLKSHTSENSQKVLSFLLLLSIYGLVPSFNEDEVLKLFGFAAQHEIAVKLFGTLGFADTVCDFVQNLIRGAAYCSG